jgi:DNA mismatch endonuclease (patch repair protein)
MAAIRSKNTRPELAMRKLLRAAGLRYLIHRRGLPGRPDIVFPKERVAVFVDGDFWHGRDWPQRLAAGQFKTRRKFWIAKIERNIQRDKTVNFRLCALGWSVMRVWATDIQKDGPKIVKRLCARLQRRRQCV